MIGWLGWSVVVLSIAVAALVGMKCGDWKLSKINWEHPEEGDHGGEMPGWLYILMVVPAVVAIIEACFSVGWQQITLWCVVAWLSPVLTHLMYRVAYSQISYTFFPKWRNVMGWLAWPVLVVGNVVIWLYLVISPDGREHLRDYFTSI